MSEVVTMPLNPRETMRVLPRWLQPFLTWLTGMPLRDQQPRFLWTPALRATHAAVMVAIGVGLACVGFTGGWLWILLLPVGWLVATSGMRDLYLVIEHYCIHHVFSKSRLVNRVVAETISTVLLVAPYHLFRHDHLTHHYVTRSDNDPDAQFLFRTGFRPGMSRDEFRSYLLRTSFSPAFHLAYLTARLKWNFATGPAHRIATSCLYVGTVGVVLTITHGWTLWCVAWLFPSTIPFQISSLINYHGEHRWLADRSGPRRAGSGRAATARVCLGRFCGDPVPAAQNSTAWYWAGAWSVWWLRVVFFHIPNRLFVLVGDEAQHDLHHRRPGSDWANAAYVRRDDIAAGCPGWPEGYTDVWGSLLDHLDACVDDPIARLPVPNKRSFTILPQRYLAAVASR